jgi:hypothetical protein
MNSPAGWYPQPDGQGEMLTLSHERDGSPEAQLSGFNDGSVLGDELCGPPASRYERSHQALLHANPTLGGAA